MVRMFKHEHQATLFEQAEVRLPNGDYRPDAPQLLQEFWLKHGLYIELEHTGLGDRLLVKHILCVEDIS